MAACVSQAASACVCSCCQCQCQSTQWSQSHRCPHLAPGNSGQSINNSPPQAATADSHHINNMDYLSDTENFYNYDYNDIMTPRAAGTTNTLFLGVFITIIPKVGKYITRCFFSG